MADDDSFTWAPPDRANFPDFSQSVASNEDDPSEQWFFQFQEHLLLTVQAVQRLQLAFRARMP